MGLCESPLVGSLSDTATSYSMPPLHPDTQLLSEALYIAGWWLPAVIAVSIEPYTVAFSNAFQDKLGGILCLGDLIALMSSLLLRGVCNYSEIIK